MERVRGDYKLGDVVNLRGDILVRNPTLDNPDGLGVLQKGVVWVTEAQAEAAKKFGWRIIGAALNNPQLVEVTRGVLLH